jgi:deoxycytidylate deaminase
LEKTAHIITSLKRPEEVNTLRRIYGSGFFLIGLSASRAHRDLYFKERGMTSVAPSLIEKDASEAREFGQQMRETFHLADVFVSMDGYSDQLERFLDVIFGSPKETPTREEQAMFTAYGASLRSGDLSRQVGAAILDPHGDLLSVGCNEAPKPTGGLYGPEKGSDMDIERKEDSNEVEKGAMIERILGALNINHLSVNEARRLLKPTGLTDITEFGRSVHAEMEALLACARTGRSVLDATLYATTFPCHNCCRHIIAAGIAKVVYIEPYAKSKASVLHSDAISIDETEEGKIPFMPFIGVGPRRYFDLFSLKLSTGYPIERKRDGKLVEWERSTAPPRLQLQPGSYLDRERLAWANVKTLLS